MNREELKKIAESLIDTFNIAGQESIDLYKKGLKIEIKEDKSPVSNGDLKANELITPIFKSCILILKLIYINSFFLI